jgi:hypothetical protein
MGPEGRKEEEREEREERKRASAMMERGNMSNEGKGRQERERESCNKRTGRVVHFSCLHACMQTKTKTTTTTKTKTKKRTPSQLNTTNQTDQDDLNKMKESMNR